MEYSEQRYLLAKRSVDDRALNRVVLDHFKEALSCLREPSLLEVGAGVGTMVQRLADWGLLANASAVQYTLVDRDAESLARAHSQLLGWADESTQEGSSLQLRRGSLRLEVQLVREDALVFCGRSGGQFDAILANAVLDLLTLETALPQLWHGLKAGGLYWFTINFDGETIFLPELPLDAAIMAAYNRTMDERELMGGPPGDSRTGRRLLMALPESGARVASAGSSDWVVLPAQAGYPQDEEYFLEHILRTIEGSVGDWLRARADEPDGVRPSESQESQGSGLSLSSFSQWVVERRAHIRASKLVYIAHQLDVFGRGPEATGA